VKGSGRAQQSGSRCRGEQVTAVGIGDDFRVMERAMAMLVEPAAWAEQQFGNCDLGDARRTKRLVKVAMQAAARPDGSTPDQSETWGKCKAVYRLMDCDDVSHANIIGPHCEQTRQSCPVGSVKLILCDTTDVDFGRSVPGLGPVGNEKNNRGFFLHSGLMRDAATGTINGLAGQELFYRRPKSRKKVHKNTKRLDPNRESVVWGKLIDQIGAPPQGVRWIHVCDRGADDYEVYLRAYLNGCGWVIRAARLNRNVQTVAGDDTTLAALLSSGPVCDHLEVSVPRQGNRPARTAKVELRYVAFRMPQPSRINEWIREHAPSEPLLMWCVQITETDPPSGAEALTWTLLTSETVLNTSQALQVVESYKKRWGVEEYHKALKTGCHVEERYYQTSERLERVTGLHAILALRLLQMRTLADENPELPAIQIVPKEWIETLAQIRKQPLTEMTIHQFVRHLAGLGGHLGRKRDGRPGWITLWRGLEKLLLILRGSALARKRCG